MTYFEVPLAGGVVALIDAADRALIEARPWRVHEIARGQYVRRYAASGSRTIYMHRLILDAPAGLQVDHINHDGLDNRRANLRLASPSQNGANMRPKGGVSRFRGVYWNRRRSLWGAQIKVDRVNRNLGGFPSEEDAARAYDEAALAAWGQFATLNLPGGGR